MVGEIISSRCETRKDAQSGRLLAGAEINSVGSSMELGGLPRGELVTRALACIRTLISRRGICGRV